MDFIKGMLGLVIIVLGICFGLYVGVYVCLVGGIVDIIDQIKAAETNSATIAWGVVKIVFAAPVGWLVFWFCAFIASIFLKD